MTNRILFVDDEQSLLNGIERRLSGTFDLVTANGGSAALATMDERGPFAVVVTDMRMPKMDGLQFIKQAQAKSPETVYIMLTGNQDQMTAIQALNEGKVFRFLTKPCQSGELSAAVEAALRQHELVTGEKELLQNTFCGAVSVLTDVLALSHPNIFNRSERIQNIVERLQQELGLSDQWEYKLAARLGLLGFALLPDADRVNVDMGTQIGGGASEPLRRAAATGQRLIERIPRLTTVARIIGHLPQVDGSVLIRAPRTEEAKAHMGATLLRIAMLWDDVMRQNLDGAETLAELRRLLPGLSADMATAVESLPSDESGEESIEIRFCDLQEGMVLCEDVLSDNGNMLIRNGRRLNWSIIERLCNAQVSNQEARPIRVRASSCKKADRALNQRLECLGQFA
jgi:DNA-binding response OmpR family regulator